MYEYAARALNVLDGDSVYLEIDLGLKVMTRAHVRLAHINAPELHQEKGAAARDRLTELLRTYPIGEEPLNRYPLTIKTTKDKTEKYGRWLATIKIAEGLDVGETLVKEGLATPYEGGRR
ncbi:MAG: thermonuclease family protein [Actinomycetota bacterium]